MKTFDRIARSLAHGSLVVVIASLAFLPNTALAQEKGAERLMRLNRRPSPEMNRLEVPKTVPMSCPKCRDVTVLVPDTNAKGGASLLAGGRPMKSVVRHQCEGCTTTLTAVGHGKTKKNLVQHTCTSCGADSKSCCDRTGKLTPTRGM